MHIDLIILFSKEIMNLKHDILCRSIGFFFKDEHEHTR